MKNYSIQATMISLPAPTIPGQPIPVVIALPDNATPLHAQFLPQALLLHYLVPCDEKGNPIEEVVPTNLFETAWNELYKLYGERSEQDGLDVMDSVLKGVILELEGEIEAEAEQES